MVGNRASVCVGQPLWRKNAAPTLSARGFLITDTDRFGGTDIHFNATPHWAFHTTSTPLRRRSYPCEAGFTSCDTAPRFPDRRS